MSVFSEAQAAAAAEYEARVAELVSKTAQLGEAVQALERAQADLGSAAVEIAALQAERDSLTAEVADLSRRLAECEGTGPPPVAPALLGWNSDHPAMTAKRWYYQWDDSRERMEAEAVARLASNVVPLHSLKMPDWTQVRNGQHDAALSRYHDQLPSGLLHCTHHEPENDGDTAANFRGAFDRVSTFLPDGVTHVVCLMGWTADPRSRRDLQAWIPETAEMIALDRYNMFRSNSNPGAPWQWPEELFDDALNAIENAGLGLPVAIWECNSYEDPDDPERKGEWIRRAADLAEAHGLLGLTFFDSRRTQPNDFRLLTSPAARAAVDEIAARPYFRRAA